MRLKSLTTATAMVLAVAATGASAATLFEGSTVGSWVNIQGGGTINVNNNDGLGGNAELDWGNPVTTTFNNLWSFDGVGSDSTPGWSTNDSSTFKIGDFSYRNGSVNGHTFTGADLQIDLTLTNPFSATDSYSFQFDMISTTNVGAGCCDDSASIFNSNSSQTFMFGGDEYTLKLFGFSQDGGTTLKSIFDSPEGSTAGAGLYAQITQPAPVVPLPAAGWMLIAGLGGLAAMKRRNDKAAA